MTNIMLNVNGKMVTSVLVLMLIFFTALTKSADAASPVIAPIPIQTIVIGEPIVFTVSATDADGDALTFLLGPTAPTGATIDHATGVFSWTPTTATSVFFDILVSDGKNPPVSTGKLIESPVIGGMATWGFVKAQAQNILGIELDDLDAVDMPLLATDLYGNFLRGANGFPQLATPGANLSDSPVLMEGNPLTPIDASLAIRARHAFLDDIAHNANPVNTRGVALPADSDNTIGLSEPGTYDNELLDAHYIAGDGRVNENIGLTSVHHIFHSEHNRLVEYVKKVILETGDLAFLSQWLASGPAPATFPVTPEEIATLSWNGERLFQAARFGTEMQYQHLAFEEFARKIQPEVNVFTGYHAEIDPAIVAEFAHTVYRFGHTIILDTLGRVDNNGTANDIGLIQAFLNPLEFVPSGLTPEQAVGAVVRGTTRQISNEIDEFVTEAVRDNLLGLPLDLASINLARGRDTGAPSLNAARRKFFAATGGNTALKPYASWAEYVLNVKYPESIVNFIAAYGTHSSITATTTLADKRTAATLLVLGGPGAPVDRLDFLNSTGSWANDANNITITGLDDVDFWIGGLAEATPSFGGLLGTTFNFVFEMQLEKLQDGDRFYYLSRTAGLNFIGQLEQNSFAQLIMRNTDLGAVDAGHLPADIFSRPHYILEVDQAKQFNDGLGSADPESGDPLIPLVIRGLNSIQFNGDGLHVVLGGSENNDFLIAGNENDTIWGDGGNDRIEGGNGDDSLMGGDGDDIITDRFGVENIKGGSGNDVINAGPGLGDLILAGQGSDFIIAGLDPKETFGGSGNDFIIAGDSADTVFGNEGDDWIEGGSQADLLQGDNGNPFTTSDITGNDIIIGDGGDDDYDAESGDDIMFAGPGIERNAGMLGFDWVTYARDGEFAEADLRFDIFQPPSIAGLRDRFKLVEGLSGGPLNDILLGDDRTSVELLTVEPVSGQNNGLNNSQQITLVDGLGDLLGPSATSFSGGNIILGGDGSDLIEGRGGDDLIDGDAWLNARISVRDTSNPNIELFSFNSMTELQISMIDGSINPGQLVITREILTPAVVADDIDTAVFSGFSFEYAISAPDALGRITVNDIRPNPIDGIDTLRNIERLQFADQTIDLGASNIVATPGLNGIDPVPSAEPLSEGGLTIVKSDLQFILDQIKIAETHADGVPLSSLIPNNILPWGLRTVDGTLNNLIPNQTDFGAADRIFPRLTAPFFQSAENVSIDLDGPGPLQIGDPTSYTQTNGFVFDSRPRIISNLIADQTLSNPAAVTAAGPGAMLNPNTRTLTIPNVAPDEGLSAPFNQWFMYFGQFFDHGLDLVKKRGSGTVFIPLQPDDSLFNPASPQTNFMVLTRATNQAGLDGVLGTADDIHEHLNQTSPFVDQNQTYASHPSHQVFLRAWEEPNADDASMTVIFSALASTMTPASVSLVAGWNLITLPSQPVDNTGATTTINAESFGQAVDATLVTKWDKASQQYISHVVGIPLNNFDLIPGEGFFVNVPTVATFAYSSSPIQPNYPPSLGWNLFGWTGITPITAETFGSSLAGTADIVVIFNPQAQQYQSHVMGIPLNNFEISAGRGMFVHITTLAP